MEMENNLPTTEDIPKLTTAEKIIEEVLAYLRDEANGKPETMPWFNFNV